MRPFVSAQLTLPTGRRRPAVGSGAEVPIDGVGSGKSGAWRMVATRRLESRPLPTQLRSQQSGLRSLATWAEGRALRGRNSSADPGAKILGERLKSGQLWSPQNRPVSRRTWGVSLLGIGPQGCSRAIARGLGISVLALNRKEDEGKRSMIRRSGARAVEAVLAS